MKETRNITEFSPDGTPVFDSSARRDYIRFQFCIWGFFWVISLIAFRWDRSPVEIKPYIAGLITFETAMTALCSHVLWIIARRWKWFARPSTARGRGLAACLVGAAIVAVATFPLNLLVYKTDVVSGFARFGMPILMLENWVGAFVGLAIWGGLYSAYYYQAQNRRLETERARLLAATHEAQLLALKGQINPHFLFNSLNTLRALIQREPVTAREAVTHLADMMRYSLTLSDYPVIPLTAELDFVNDYLALEHLRHEDRLRIQKIITPEALCENIPPMLLQTLVENAVKHGLSQRSGGILVTCEIRIVPAPSDSGARDSGSCLRLRVTNQGHLQSAPAKAVETTGTGLRNVSERLRLIYGDRASLTVTGHDGLVVAEVVVPVETPSADVAERKTPATFSVS